MVQYLLNVTVIWLLSLIVFGLFLKRTTHHTYNRVYLLITSIFGALLPLYQPSTPGEAMAPAIVRPAYAISEVKQDIVTAALATEHSISWTAWIAGAYGLGVLISVALLLREAALLYRMYRAADKRTEDGIRWVITRKAHGPFSLFGYLFISDPADYSETELRFIRLHESIHIRRRHSIDKILLLLMRCLFWAHPLSWIYYRELILVHEFEADETARPASADYGRFLINQHLSAGVPALAHSFFHSPLKIRIRMLTKTRTQAWRKAAYVLALPAIAAFSILWVNNSAATKRDKQGSTVTFRGNRFELGLPELGNKAMTGTFRARQNTTGTIDRGAQITRQLSSPEGMLVTTPFSLEVKLDSVPVTMNGRKIFQAADLAEKPVLMKSNSTPLELVVEDIEPDLNKLPDGKYAFQVRDLIIDEKGRVVYYEVMPISWAVTGVRWPNSRQEWDSINKAAKLEEAAHSIDESLQQKITKGIEQSLDKLVFKPGQKDGEAVVTRISFQNGARQIVVRNGKAAVSRTSFD